MTAADDYNAEQLAGGAVTAVHVTELTRAWQSAHPPLKVDGMCGQQTIASIEAATRPAPFLRCPLPVLAGGRTAQVTSEFRPTDRPNHDGLDWFYPWRAGDKPDFVGDGGCAGQVDGHPKWVIPYGTCALAAAPGVVQIAGNSATGYRIWVDHENGLRTGYFHLRDCRVLVGQRVALGHPLGEVGDNPADHDGRHLHFELSPVDRYEPIDPAPFLVG